jgi:hypothetical protein
MAVVILSFLPSEWTWANSCSEKMSFHDSIEINIAEPERVYVNLTASLLKENSLSVEEIRWLADQEIPADPFKVLVPRVHTQQWRTSYVKAFLDLMPHLKNSKSMELIRIQLQKLLDESKVQRGNRDRAENQTIPIFVPVLRKVFPDTEKAHVLDHFQSKDGIWVLARIGTGLKFGIIDLETGLSETFENTSKPVFSPRSFSGTPTVAYINHEGAITSAKLRWPLKWQTHPFLKIVENIDSLLLYLTDGPTGKPTALAGILQRDPEEFEHLQFRGGTIDLNSGLVVSNDRNNAQGILWSTIVVPGGQRLYPKLDGQDAVVVDFNDEDKVIFRASLPPQIKEGKWDFSNPWLFRDPDGKFHLSGSYEDRLVIWNMSENIFRGFDKEDKGPSGNGIYYTRPDGKNVVIVSLSRQGSPRRLLYFENLAADPKILTVPGANPQNEIHKGDIIRWRGENLLVATEFDNVSGKPDLIHALHFINLETGDVRHIPLDSFFMKKYLFGKVGENGYIYGYFKSAQGIVRMQLFGDTRIDP